MSLQVIVVAVIALVVLVVLIMMFTGKVKVFGSATADCGTKGGVCQYPFDTSNPTCPQGTAKMFGAKCSEEGQICCAPMEG